MWAKAEHFTVETFLSKTAYLQMVMNLSHRWVIKEDEKDYPFSPLTIQKFNVPNLV